MTGDSSQPRSGSPSGSRAARQGGASPPSGPARERLVNGSVFVEFVWTGDRFAHAIGLITSNEPLLVFQSLEGDSSQDWPPSPPLQQLSVEPGPDGKPRAFLVGMAGSSHWSLVVEPIDGGYLFDAAVRCRSAPEFRGSCYTRLAPSVELDVRHLRASFEEPDDSPFTLPHPRYGRMSPHAAANPGLEPWLVLGPNTSVGRLPATFQWRYEATTARNPLA